VKADRPTNGDGWTNWVSLASSPGHQPIPQRNSAVLRISRPSVAQGERYISEKRPINQLRPEGAARVERLALRLS